MYGPYILIICINLNILLCTEKSWIQIHANLVMKATGPGCVKAGQRWLRFCRGNPLVVKTARSDSCAKKSRIQILQVQFSPDQIIVATGPGCVKAGQPYFNPWMKLSKVAFFYRGNPLVVPENCELQVRSDLI